MALKVTDSFYAQSYMHTEIIYQQHKKQMQIIVKSKPYNIG